MPSTPSHVARLAPHHYEFLSDWVIPTDGTTAFTVLADLWSYPKWWPEFKTADRTSPDDGAFALRSALPFTLRFTLHREIEDEAQGLLRATAAGDIVGTVEWKLERSPRETIAHFSQYVTLNHAIARRADFVLRPVLTWNHAQAMRSGHEGLRSYIAKQNT